MKRVSQVRLKNGNRFSRITTKIKDGLALLFMSATIILIVAVPTIISLAILAAVLKLVWYILFQL